MKVKFTIKDKNCPVTDAIEAAKESLDNLETVLNSEGTPIPEKNEAGVNEEPKTVAGAITDEIANNKTEEGTDSENKTDIPTDEEDKSEEEKDNVEKTDEEDTNKGESEGSEQAVEVEEKAIAEVTEAINTLVEDAKTILDNLSEGIIDTNSIKKLNDSCDKYLNYELVI